MAPTPIPHFKDRFEAHAYHAAATKQRKADEREAKRIKGICKITEYTKPKVGVVALDRCCHGNGPGCEACAKAAKTRVLNVNGKELRETINV